MEPSAYLPNISLDSALLKEAKSLSINVSRFAEAGIAEAVKLQKQGKRLNPVFSIDGQTLVISTQFMIDASVPGMTHSL